MDAAVFGGGKHFQWEASNVELEGVEEEKREGVSCPLFDFFIVALRFCPLLPLRN
jgi:hypothetical protein